METRSNRYVELIARDLAENQQTMSSEAIIDRLSWANVVCYYAEQGVASATQFLVKLLHQEPSFKIRRLIVKRLMFASRPPVTHEKRKVMEATITAIADDHADVRGLVIELCDRKCLDKDKFDVDMYLPVSNRNSALHLRGNCASSNKFENSTALGTEGTGAWLTLQDIAIAFKDRIFLEGLVSMISHEVFSVRICMWLLLSDSSFTSEIERCKTLEIKITQLEKRLTKLENRRQHAEERHDNAIRDFMENSRDKIAFERKKLQGRMNEEILAQKTEEIIQKVRSFGIRNDEMILTIGKELERARQKENSTRKDLSLYSESYQHCVSSLKEMIIAKVGSMLSYNSLNYLSLNSFFENKSRENWYIRMSALEFLGKIAKAGFDSAKQFLSTSENDRSPYVRRAYKNVVQEVHALKIHNDQSQNQIILPESNEFVAGICATPEDQRKFNKALRLRKQRMEEEKLIRSVNISELRPRFLDQTDRYIRQAKRNDVDGEQLLEMSEKDMREVLGITMRKNRAILKLKIKEKMDNLLFYTDPQRMASADKELLQESAKQYLRVMKVDARPEHEDSVVKALSFDAPHADGDKSRCTAVLTQRSDGRFIFSQVSHVSAGVKDGDVLFKVQDSMVDGLSWHELAGIFLAHGQVCMCTIQISPDWAGEDNASALQGPATQLARTRTLQIISHCNPEHPQQHLEILGLNLEIMSFDDFQLLQLINWFSRRRFSQYLPKVLRENNISDLRHLATHHANDEWLKGLQIEEKDLAGFREAMTQLATKFGIIRDDKNLEGKDRVDLGFDWSLLHGNTASYVSRHASRFRTQDASEDLKQFKATGRDAVVVERNLEGLEYYLLWHRRMNVGIELRHTSTGMLRLYVPTNNNTAITPVTPSQLKVFLVYSDGSVELTRGLNAMELWVEMWKQEPVDFSQEKEEEEEEEEEEANLGSETATASVASDHQANILGFNFGSFTTRSDE
eukprot:756002-Hanusia_phi.AAC.3